MMSGDEPTVLTAILETQRALGQLTATIQQSIKEHTAYESRITVLEKDHVPEEKFERLANNVDSIQSQMQDMRGDMSGIQGDVSEIKARMDRPRRWSHRVYEWFKDVSGRTWFQVVGYFATALATFLIGWFK